MDKQFLILLFVLLTGAGIFLRFQLSRIGALAQAKENENQAHEKLKIYHRNMILLMEQHAETGIAEIIAGEIKKNVVLFGYNHIARFVRKELEKSGREITFIIENNEKVRREHNNGGKDDRQRLLSNEEAKEELTGDHEVLVCILHDKAYIVGDHLKEIFGPRVDVYLLEQVLIKNRNRDRKKT